MADHVCPPWIGWLLASPIRRWFQDPDKILGPHVPRGSTVVDVGCAMGFFTLPLARMVGPEGRVIGLDVQERMIESLNRRAERAKLGDRIDARVVNGGGLGLEPHAGEVAFALAFAMVHETDDPAALMRDIAGALAPAGKLLVAEPRGHVSDEQFEASIRLAEDAGLVVLERPSIARSHAALLGKG